MSSTDHDVSKAASAYYDELLEGTLGKDSGLIALYEGLSGALSNMQGNASDQGSGEPNSEFWAKQDLYAIAQRRKTASLKRTIGYLDSIINRIKLFKTHDQMPSVYGLLSEELADETQWRAFLSSALRANVDAASYREMIEKSKTLADEVATTAASLADKINQMCELELEYMPNEVFSVWHLLRRTDESEQTKGGLSKWHDLEHTLMGQAELAPEPSMTPEPIDHPSPAYDLIKDDLSESLARIQNTAPTSEDSMSEIHSAWSAAPPLQTLLRTLERSASAFSDSKVAWADTDTNSHEAREKTEYIRSLVHLLTTEQKFPMGTNIKKAIAISAAASLSEQGIEVTYDDVRKILDRNAT